jgi:hypothetical protein
MMLFKVTEERLSQRKRARVCERKECVRVYQRVRKSVRLYRTGERESVCVCVRVYRTEKECACV